MNSPTQKPQKLVLFVWLLVAGHFGFGQFKSEYGKDTVLIKKDNKTMEGITVKHKKEGLWFSYDPDGRVTSKGNYVHDVQQGVWVNYGYYSGTKDTIINIGTFRDGGQIGTWTDTYPNIGYGVYKIVTEYDASHNIAKTTCYKNGNIVPHFNGVPGFMPFADTSYSVAPKQMQNPPVKK